MLPLLATLVDFCGPLVILAASVVCLWGYLRVGGDTARADGLRLRLAQALVLALSFKTGAGVIRTATVAHLAQVGTLAAIIALRFLLGRVVKAESARQSARPYSSSSSDDR